MERHEEGCRKLRGIWGLLFPRFFSRFSNVYDDFEIHRVGWFRTLDVSYYRRIQSVAVPECGHPDILPVKSASPGSSGTDI